MTILSPRPQIVTTTDATPTLLVKLQAATPRGVLRTTGRILARNTATDDAISWDAAITAKVTPGGGTLFGAPAIAPFQDDASMAGCVVTAAATASGISILVTGLIGTTIAWASDFSALLEA